MIREAIEELKEATPRAIIEHIRKKNPLVNINESSFRSDIIGCSINHSSSHHYPGMPKFLHYDKQRGTYRLYERATNESATESATTKLILENLLRENVSAKDRERRIGEELLRAFENGVGTFKEYTSDTVNENDLDSELYADYVTFISAIDYQKNIEAKDLWKAGKRWARKYPWLFKPKKLMNKPVAQVIADFRAIRERDSRFSEYKTLEYGF